MPSTAGCVAAQADGGGAMMMALPPLSAIIALLTGVADGLVEGVRAPTTPTGLAYLTIPFSGMCSMMPVDFTLSRSRSVPNVFRWFLTTLLSTSPMPVTSTAISASRRALLRLVDRPGQRGDGLVDACLAVGGNLVRIPRHRRTRLDDHPDNVIVCRHIQRASLRRALPLGCFACNEFSFQLVTEAGTSLSS